MLVTEQEFVNAARGVACFTGKTAEQRFEELLKPVSKGQWNEFEFLLETARHFGALVLFAHKDDKETNRATSAVLNPEKGYPTNVHGVYRWLDGWIEVVLCRLQRWEQVEEVLRHELVHLLQHATSTPENRETNLVTDHLRYGRELAAEFRSNPREGCILEAEAYGVDKETKFLRAWVVELKRHPERTQKWTCLTREAESDTQKNKS